MKYVTKQIEVDAVQFVDPDLPLPEGVERGHEARYGGNDQSFFRHKYGPIYNYFIKNKSGDFQVRPGDWVITTKDGNRYPISDEEFKQCFDAVQKT